ncbi:MAG: nucleotidyltransferase family protein [Chloroflexales bacterium]|nr:nucleotidyltransferase family protein [Chloroflexales bacterium]
MMIYGVLLAAGMSLRMGRPKQLLPWRGRPLVRHIAEVALASRLAGLVIVLGAGAQEARAALVGLSGPVETVQCDDYAAGQAASLRCGLAALPAAATAAVVLLVDQPLVGAPLVDHLIVVYEADPGALAVVPRYQGRRGNPVLLAAGLFADLRALEGDMGARAVLERHAAAVCWLDIEDPAVVADADTPEAYASLRENDEGQGEVSSL